jgi:hypothetical protein
LLLRTLALAQNAFLLEMVPLVQRTTALQALSLGGDAVDLGAPVELSRLQRAHVLLNDLDLEWLRGKMLSCGVSTPGAGLGRQLTFGFDVCEVNLAMVTAEAVQIRLDADAPPFRYLGELLQQQADLMAMLEKALPQEPVDNVHKLREAPFLQEAKNGTAALALLEAVVFSCAKVAPDRDETLQRYCAVFDAGGAPAAGVLQCAALCEIKLKHLRSAYETIEDLIADAVIHTTPDRCAPRRPCLATCRC